MNYNPIIINEHGRTSDLLSANLENRIIMLSGEIDSDLAAIINSQLLYLDSVNHEDIYLYINSPGGEVNAGLSIYDTMHLIKSDVHTICQGMAASMAAVILSGGSKGKRSILPHGEVMIHQPSSGTEGKATDITIVANHINRLKSELTKILAENTGTAEGTVANDIEKDYWMNANEAKNYGIIDKIIK